MRLGRRPAIHIFPAHHRAGIKQTGTVFKILFVIGMFFVGVWVVLAQLRPVIYLAAEDETNRIAAHIINQVIYEKFSDENVSYNDLVDINTGEDDKIVSINTNINEMNRLKSELALLVMEKIDSIDDATVSFPLGSAFGNDLIAGMGPEIKIRLQPVSDVNVNFINNFSQAGINQTKHEVFIEVSADIGVILPMGVSSTEVKTTVCAAQTVIVGDIPTHYFDTK